MAADLVILDYGSGNVRSMENALRRVARADQRVLLTRDAAAIDGAERLVLPGVGAFAECRRLLDESAVLAPLLRATAQGRPLLGVCVGMQVLADEGREFEVTSGLGLLPGVVEPLAPQPAAQFKLPHIGWAPVEVRRTSPLWEGIAADATFYFLHSYALRCRDAADEAARADYGGTFTAAAGRGSVFGCQFHPEKSGDGGLALLANFCRWEP